MGSDCIYILFYFDMRATRMEYANLVQKIEAKFCICGIAEQLALMHHPSAVRSSTITAAALLHVICYRVIPYLLETQM